jgi:photosystem II stability/assembly factor-like uncharacterized protein
MAQGGQVNDPQLAQSGRVRIWLQQGVANPGVQYTYMGRCQLEKTTQDLGKINPVYVPSSTQRNTWDIVDVVPTVPALPTTAFTQHANRYLTDEWISVRYKNCLVNLKAIFSNCARPDDPTQWDAIMLLTRARLSKLDMPVLNMLDGAKNEVIDIMGDIEAQGMVFIYPMAFQQYASVTAVAELVDGFYYDQITCGECGLPSDGCQKAYALQVSNSGSPGLSSQLLYTANGGVTWAAMDIPTLAGLSAARMAPQGIYCVVVSTNQAAYHYALFSDIQNGTIRWVSQTSGFLAGKSPKCITVKDPNTGFIGAQGGVIYLLSSVGSAVTVLADGTQSAQDVNDIHYFGNIVVAVQNNNGVLVSTNKGLSWNLVTGPLVGQNLSAVWCLNANTWFVGTGNGQLWYTQNAGVNWTQSVFDAGSFTTINDIQFFDENIGYMAVEIGGVGRVYRTVDCGATWQQGGNSSAINALPSPGAQRINVVAPCGYNTVLAVGRKTTGGSGALYIARNQN